MVEDETFFRYLLIDSLPEGLYFGTTTFWEESYLRSEEKHNPKIEFVDFSNKQLRKDYESLIHLLITYNNEAFFSIAPDL